MQRARRPKKEADGPRLVGGRYNKQGNLLMKIVLGDYKVSRSLCRPTRILTVYTKALMGFSHVSSPDGLNNKATSLQQLLAWEQGAKCAFQGREKG